MKEKNTKLEIINEEENRKAILVGLQIEQEDNQFEDAMDELAELAKACNIEPVMTITQKALTPIQSTYIGKGKVEELKKDIEYFDADLIIFDQMLSPMQFRNLGTILKTEVMDRTGLILRIFSEQAKTREARLQVEYANLKYLLPRLAGMWSHLSRQGGASGSRSSRGEGEKQIELDRRYIEHKIVEVEKELKKISKERETQRGKRNANTIPQISLVGYTNAGKSTLMNALLDTTDKGGLRDKKVLMQDKLFATLDTTVRKIAPKGHKPFLLSDTVGFISELPHFLVKGFRSTLEEVKHADLLLEVIDFSNPEYQSRIDVTRKTLEEIGANNIPIIYVYNKSDMVKPYPEGEDEIDAMNWGDSKCNYSNVKLPFVKDNNIYISAKNGIGIEELLDLIESYTQKNFIEVSMILPFERGDIFSKLKEKGEVISCEYKNIGILVNAKIHEKEIDKYKDYLQ